MKKCVSCRKDIPDNAGHCVFCGSRQGQVQTAAPAQKTIMGYSAADLDLAKMGNAATQMPFGNPPGGSPAAKTMMGPGIGGAPQASPHQPTMMAPALGAGPQPASPHQATMMVGATPAAPMGPGKTMMAPGGAPQHMPTQMAPAFGGQPMGGQPMGQPTMAAPQMQQQQPMQIASPHLLEPQRPQPVPQPMAMPQPMPQPQYLASRAQREEPAPIEPWSASLRFIMVFFGAVMVASFVVPWALPPGGDPVFSWDMIDKAGTTGKVWPFMLIGLGLISLLLGILPVEVNIRGLGASFAGLFFIMSGIFLGSLATGSDGGIPRDWQTYSRLAGMILAPAGLLIRSQYKGAILGRLLALLGCVGILLPVVIPVHGQIILVEMFKGLGHLHGTMVSINYIWQLLLPVTAVLGLLLVWLPRGTSAGTGFLAKILIFWGAGVLLINLIVAPIVHQESLEGVFRSPIVPLMIINTLGFWALSSYGLATVFGKSLED